MSPGWVADKGIDIVVGMGPPERIIAGVVLCERLAVGMYGAVHRAQREGQRHLRALVVEPRLLAEPDFHRELLDSGQAEKVVALSCDQIVPTLAIESEGADVVVVTHGVGRYVTVQDMLASARARGFKIERSVVAAVALATADALAAAHRARVVHGAVHPRSVLVDEAGAVRLTDFGVGRALTAAVSQGGDSVLWRGLAGFLAPELAIGSAPGPQSDVFALGALLFVMLTGDAPPGSLGTTPAVDRVVSKSLDTDPNHRHRNPDDLAEALRVAFSSDGWAVATPTDIIAAAGLETEGGGLDSDTEDLLAALGSASPAPMRPHMDLRAEVVAARGAGNEGETPLDALLADLGEDHDLAEASSEGRDGGSEHTPAQAAATHRPGRRQGSPAVHGAAGNGVVARDSARVIRTGGAPAGAANRSAAAIADYDVTTQLDAVPTPERLQSTESAAMGALADLRDPTIISARPPHMDNDDSVTHIQALPRPRQARPSVETPRDLSSDLPVPSLRRSRLWSLLWASMLVATAIAAVMVYQSQREQSDADRKRRERDMKAVQDLSARLTDGLPDPGSIRLWSDPVEATGWLLVGRTPCDSIPLSSSMVHQVRVELERYRPREVTIDGSLWKGAENRKEAHVTVKLERLGKGSASLSASPAEPGPGKGLSPGNGVIHFTSEPPGAAVWLYLGVTGSIEFRGIAGREYELRALKDGYLPGFARISVDDWRATKGDVATAGPIDAVPKKSAVDLKISLTVDSEAPSKPDGRAVRRRSE